jgi:hypothetical protein
MIRLKSNIWHRDNMVGMILCFSVVARMKMAWAGRFFQRFEERVESRLAKHVHLVNDVDLEFALLWRKPHLIYQVADVVHRVVARGIKLKDVECELLVLGSVAIGIDGLWLGFAHRWSCPLRVARRKAAPAQGDCSLSPFEA